MGEFVALYNISVPSKGQKAFFISSLINKCFVLTGRYNHLQAVLQIDNKN
jgi:hypothetical protein